MQDMCGMNLRSASALMYYSAGPLQNKWEREVIPCEVLLHFSSTIFILTEKTILNEWDNLNESLEGTLLVEQKNLLQLCELYLACCKKK